MSVERVLKLFRQSLNLESFSEQLLLQVVDLLSEVRNLRSLRLDDSKLTLVVTNLELKKSDILQSFSILDFTSS